jgi:hypothetical protein
MAKISNMMVRAVAIGTLKEYKYSTEGFVKGQGVLEVVNGGQTSNVRFTIFNNDKEDAKNPHTKALDFNTQYAAGDKIYLTGSDNRQYSAEKDIYYEDIQVWDFRAANDDEMSRWVYVYVGDVTQLDSNELEVSYLNYKQKETLFQINVTKTHVPAGIEAGDRIKVKGTIFSGRKEDYFGDGEYVTERTAAEVKVLNTKAEIEESKAETDGPIDETKLW